LEAGYASSVEWIILESMHVIYIVPLHEAALALCDYFYTGMLSKISQSRAVGLGLLNLHRNQLPVRVHGLRALSSP
jgi:hypothetical protein